MGGRRRAMHDVNQAAPLLGAPLDVRLWRHTETQVKMIAKTGGLGVSRCLQQSPSQQKIQSHRLKKEISTPPAVQGPARCRRGRARPLIKYARKVHSMARIGT